MLNRLKILYQFIGDQKLRIFLATASLMASLVILLYIPQVIQFTIDNVLDDKPLDLAQPIISLIQYIGGQSVLYHYLWACGSLIVIMTIFVGLFGFLSNRWTALAGESIAKNMRDRLYDHLHHLPCEFHDKNKTGDLIQRCTTDVETIRIFVSSQFVQLLHSIIMLCIVIPIMISISWWMLLAGTAFLPLIIAFSLIFFFKVKNSFKAMEQSDGALTSVLQENLTGIRIVRAFARQNYEQDKFAKTNADYREKGMHLYYLMAWFWGASDLLIFIQLGTVLIGGAYLVKFDIITIGALVASTIYVSMFIYRVREMGRILVDLGRSLVSLERVEMILDSPIETDPDDIITDLPDHLIGKIEFHNVTFSHTTDLPVLDDISFDVMPGQTLAILGASGSGKSTIVNLMLRFYDYNSGSITFDDYELKRLPRKFTRSQIGVVMQEPFLYSKSLRENINIGVHDLHEDYLIEATSTACIHDAITTFDQGYDTIVGERGVTLSGGQRQRIALARAILQQHPILILDDAFSAVDTRTEKMILNALRQRHGNQTTIVIAHRLSTLMHADKIIVVDDKHITQIGTHEQLIQTPGLYRRLWELQNAFN